MPCKERKSKREKGDARSSEREREREREEKERKKQREVKGKDIIISLCLFSFSEWGDEVINHSANAILIAQYTSNYFVNQARNSTHSFPSPPAESAALIYNWAPIYSEEITGDFEQCYVWNLSV
jgi:hypothetical protein